MSETSTPANAAAATVEAIEDEARRLAALLREHDPGTSAEPLALPLTDPPRLRAFWGALGWTKDWERRQMLHRPDLPPPEAEMNRILDQLRDESPSSPALVEGGLPRRFRLVHLDPSGIGFTLTDEDDDVRREDPRVLSIIFETGTVSEIAPSYVRWCASELINRAFGQWHDMRVILAGDDALAAAAAPFSALSPETRRLDDDLWTLPQTYPGQQPTGVRRFAYARFDALVRWLERLPEGARVSIALPRLRAARVPAESAALAALLPATARTLAGAQANESYRVAIVEGVGLIAKLAPDGAQVLAGEDQSAWLAAKLGVALKPRR